MPHNVEDILKRFHDLETSRVNWDTHWQEIAELIWPSAADFRVKREKGGKRSTNIYDSTGAVALEKFAAVMESLLTPRAQKWHRLKPSNPELAEDNEVKAWFEELTQRLFDVRNSPEGNYYSQKHEGYKSLGAFGNDCLFVDEMTPTNDQPQVRIRYKYCHISQVFIEVNHLNKVDTVYRKYELSAKAAQNQWGNRITDRVRTALEGNKPFQRFEFLNVVFPRKDRDRERADFLGMPWVSLDISISDKAIVEEGGYEELPYLYSRYTVNPMEMYGRSPAMLVLPALKMSQEIQKTFIRAGHKVVDPPLLVHHDGLMASGTKDIHVTPGGLNYGGVSRDGKPLIVPLVTGARLDLTEGMLEKERQVINDAFFVNLFQILIENPKMTATEVLLRAQEKGQFLAPVVGRQQSEMLGPQIEREVNILVRNGLVPPLPDILIEAEGEYEIEYESDATRFQKTTELAGSDRSVERAITIGQFDPSALFVIKGDEYVRLSGEVEGAPTKIFRSPEEVEELVRQRQEAEAAQADLENIQRGASAAKDAASAGAQAGVVGGP